jgi:hypothetical protein
LERTAAIGTISRGIGTRFTKAVLSTTEVVPQIQAMVKKLYGTRPQRTKTGKFLIFGFGKTRVKTKVSTPIITRGFRIDQRTPRDMLRYLTRKSFRTRFSRRKMESPRHIIGLLAGAGTLRGLRLHLLIVNYAGR